MMHDNHMLYLQCPDCAESKPKGISQRDFARLSVGITKGGDLHIECVRHGSIVAHIPNIEVGEELFRISSNVCGCGDHGKEMAH